MYDQALVGERMRRIRKKLNKTRRTVAEELGYSEETIKKAEYGLRLSLTLVTSFSEEYSVSLDYLFWGKKIDQEAKDETLALISALFNEVPADNIKLAERIVIKVLREFIESD